MKASIKLKFLIPTVLFILMAMGTSSFVSYFQSKNALNSLIIDQLTRQADSISTMMDSWIGERKINVQNWTRETEFPNAVDTGWVDGFSRKKSSEKLAAFHRDYASFESISLADNTGMVTASSDPDQINSSQVDSQKFFQDAMKGTMAFSQIFKSPATGRPVFAIAAPIVLAGDISGVLFGLIDFTAFSDKFITPVTTGHKGFSFVLDHQGTAVVYPDKQQVFKLSLAKMEAWAAIHNKKDGIVNIRLNQSPCVVAFKQLKEPLVYIGAVADRDEIFSPITVQAEVNAATVAISIIIAVLIILFITNSILKPLKEVVTRLKEAAEGDGDLTTRIDVIASDETGELAESFNVFIGKIQHIIADVARNSRDLSLSAENLAEISIEMNTASDHTSRISETVADSGEDMKNNISSVARVLDATSDNINTVAAAADQMSATINEIASNTGTASQITQTAVVRAGEVTTQMNALGTSASQINQVVSAIADISAQVNLLALNATIEAARAGESGRGFAVVANEIKDLAKQTADATDEIRAKIESIQVSTGTTISGIKTITDTVNETDDIVTSIASAIEEQSSATKEIAGNIAHVSSGVAEINESMAHTAGVAASIASQIKEVNVSTGHLSGNSDQVNTKAKELSVLARKLDSLVNQFKV